MMTTISGQELDRHARRRIPGGTQLLSKRSVDVLARAVAQLLQQGAGC